MDDLLRVSVSLWLNVMLFRAVGPHANHHERAEAIRLEADATGHAIDPDLHVLRGDHTPRAPVLILRLPRRGPSSATSPPHSRQATPATPP